MAATTKRGRDTAARHAAARKTRFLRAYESTGNLTLAATAAKIHRATHYRWLDENALYASDFATAQEIAIDGLEAEARRRALRSSDTLLIFLLKGARPEKYRERFEHVGKGGAQLFPDAIVIRRRIVGGDDPPALPVHTNGNGTGAQLPVDEGGSP